MPDRGGVAGEGVRRRRARVVYDKIKNIRMCPVINRRIKSD